MSEFLTPSALKQLIDMDGNQIVWGYHSGHKVWELMLTCVIEVDEDEDFGVEPETYYFLRRTYHDWDEPFYDWEPDDLQIGEDHTLFQVAQEPTFPVVTQEAIEELL